MKELNALEAYIADMVADLTRQGERNIYTFIELNDGTMAHVRGTAEYDGYIEDDYRCGYGNGTGAFVPTSASCDLYIEVCDKDKNEIAVDTSAIEEQVEHNLMSL